VADSPKTQSLPQSLPLSGLRVVCFESRRSAEASRLIARQGGEPVEAPSLREVPLSGPSGLGPLLADLQGGAPVLLVLLTGIGTELMIEGLSQHLSRESVLALLSAESTTLVCRGPKPHAVLKSAQIKPALVVGEPNTWRDLLRELTQRALPREQSVYVQEYGRTNAELIDGLAASGFSKVRQIKTYEWRLPEDLQPLQSAIDGIAAGEVDVALFTSGIQVTHVLQVARDMGALDKLRSGLSQTVIASVGPLTSEALLAVGLPPDIEPAHPKLGHLVVALAAEARPKLAAKRLASRGS